MSLSHAAYPRIIAVTFFVALSFTAHAAFNVRDHGATGNGETDDTAAIQATIDALSNRGGTVYFEPGEYLTGSLHLRSNIALHLDSGAVLKGIPDRNAYDPYEDLGFKNESDEETSYFHHALIWGEDIENVAIYGGGTIDANFTKRHGPKPIALKRCRFVRIGGIRILNAPNYCISLLGTDYVEIDGVTILNAFCDGIDPDSCKNVRISNCHIESWDDAIVPKASFTLGERRATENLTVTNCYLATACNAFKLGTESAGDFKRIAVSNCVMDGLKGKRDAVSGIAIESVDGSNIDGVVVSNITMVNVCSPIFIRLGNRGRDMEPDVPGTLRNVSIDNVVATNASLVCSITGIPDRNVEKVSISNVRLSFVGGAPYRPVEEAVPEVIQGYPSADNFGAMPGYAFYCQHVRGLTFSNVDVSWEDGFWRAMPTDKDDWDLPLRGVPKQTTPNPEIGNALVIDDVHNLNIANLRARPSAQKHAVLRLNNVQNALIESCVAQESTDVFLDVRGELSRDIVFSGNSMLRARNSVSTGPLPADVVKQIANTDPGP
ncbi:MAG: right-handed parallel beta-helix repeat-containing protein [Candidatus Hydrogenedentes bacterium]|nr:right-handed parallel beta-helix repeat-containing protein [Candidatus Hydrogenedentota bacterium]